MGIGPARVSSRSGRAISRRLAFARQIPWPAIAGSPNVSIHKQKATVRVAKGPPRVGLHFKVPQELSIFASADPCRKLAILQSENDHLGHFCLKVGPRASKPRFSPPRTPAENWPFYRAKMIIWDTFGSKSLPGPSKGCLGQSLEAHCASGHRPSPRRVAFQSAPGSSLGGQM